MALYSDMNGFPESGFPVLADAEDRITLNTLYYNPIKHLGYKIDVVGNNRLLGALVISGRLSGVTALAMGGALSGVTTIGASGAVTLSGGNLVMTTGSILMTSGEIGSLLARIKKAWLQDLYIKNRPTCGDGDFVALSSDLAFLMSRTARIGTATNYSEFEADGTLKFNGDATVWDDMRVVPGSFDRPGSSDPSIVAYDVNGGGVNTYLWSFAKNNIASFTVQLPHGYMVGTDIYCHVHWTPGANGVANNGLTVGWKIDYTWANINGSFGTMGTLDLSDACDGTDHKHQMTPDVLISGAGKHISSMLLCNIKRTDTGTDDTWTTGDPMILEIDFHYQIDTIGSRTISSK